MPWLALAAFLTLSLWHSPTALADTIASTTGAVSSPDGLNLRAGPGQSYPIVAVMPAGAQVTVTGSATPDNWLPLNYSGQLGWADATYITIASPAAGNGATPAAAAAAPTSPAATPAAASAAAASTPPVAAGLPTATVLPADGLNLRSGPDTSFSVLTVLAGGASLTITGGSHGAFLPVAANGQSGWVDGAYVSTDGSSPMITANSVSSTAGATLGAPAGATRDGAALAGATPSPASAAPPPNGPAPKLAWPSASRKVSTVFSPSHLGIDIDEFPAGGNPVSASAGGIVTFAGGDSCCSYGLYVVVDHGGGYSTLYAHLSSISVQKGQAVAPGQKLGLSGCTGKCTGPHVHYEVRINDKQVDPLRFLPPPWNIE